MLLLDFHEHLGQRLRRPGCLGEPARQTCHDGVHEVDLSGLRTLFTKARWLGDSIDGVDDGTALVWPHCVDYLRVDQGRRLSYTMYIVYVSVPLGGVVPICLTVG